MENHEILKNLPKACSDERTAVEFIEAQRWGDDNENACCPHCGDMDVKQMKSSTGERNARFLWRCNGCKKQFTVKIGTVMEDSRIAYRHWCFAFWMSCASKKGVSALQIQRQTGLSYKSALFLMHRIRYAMTDDHSTPEPMNGDVEIDETYVGGKPRHAREKRAKWSSKTPVVALVQRNGDVRAQVLPTVNAENLKKVIEENVSKSANIYTDESRLYPALGKEFASHESVNHSKKEYARGNATTNTVEGFFSILKRGINGTFHSVSKEHLHRYVGEFEYKYNTRKLDDGDRISLAIQKANGKRLIYKEAVGG